MNLGPTKTRAHVRGCEADTLVGAIWLCPPDKLSAWVDAAWAVVENGQLKIYQRRSAEMAEEAEERPYTVQDGIARIGLSGSLTKHPTSFQSLLGGTSMVQVRKALVQARQDPAVLGVFLDADSWGGTAEGTAELAAAITKFGQAKPIVAHAEDKATSGCLWLSIAAQRFTAGEMACVGSQGTVTQLVDSSEAVKRAGLKPVVISAGKYKGIGAPGLEITEEHQAEFRRLVNAINEPFKQAVVRSRGLSASQASEVQTARIFVGEDAKRVGLIDDIRTSDEAFEEFKQDVSNGRTAPRGPVPTPTNPAASRSNAMAFNAKQKAKALSLPGAADVSEEQLEGFVLQKAEAYRATALKYKRANEALRQEVDELKSSPSSEPVESGALDPVLLKGHVRNATKEIQLMAREGKLHPEQVTQFAALLKNPRTAAAMCAVQPDGKMMYEQVLGLFELNEPNGLVNADGSVEETGAQPAPRTEPGGDKPANKPMAYERYCELMHKGGNTPASFPEWKARQEAMHGPTTGNGKAA